MTSVDVLVVHYLRPDLTSRAVRAVSGPATRIWVWDNSGDLPELPVPVERRGTGDNRYFAAGNTALFDESSSPYVLLLNPDVELSVETLAGMTQRLAAHPEVWGVTPRLVGQDGQTQNYLHDLPTLRALLADRLPPARVIFRSAFRRYRCLDRDLDVCQLVEQPPAAALLVRREEIVAAGGLFDPAYPLFFNDVDLARRLQGRGRCLYAADLVAAHVGGASLRAAGRRCEDIGTLYDDALVRYARRHLTGHAILRAATRLRGVIDRRRGGWWQS